MDTTKFDAWTRIFDRGTRRDVVRSVVTGAAALAIGGSLLTVAPSEARKKRRRKKRNKDGLPPKTTPQSNPCEGKNWCVDRTQTCGPTDGYGKCLVEASGDNICAEILFQVASCEECGAANCTDCRCVLAAGGGDRCNNGANGYDFICVRSV
jgi:hypothetical protein